MYRSADIKHKSAGPIMLKMILGLFFISAVMVLLISVVVNIQTNRHVSMIIESTQNHLAASAMALVKIAGLDELNRFHSEDDINTAEYRELHERLIRFSEDHNVMYAYYWRPYGNGMLQYIVDNDTNPETRVGPGDIHEIEDVALNALAGKIAVTDLGTYVPSRDGLITGYAPLYDSEGNIKYVAGVDLSDEFILIEQKDARNMTILQITALSVSVIFGFLNMMLYRNKARQTEEANIKLQHFDNNLRRAFSTYLSEDVVEEIISNPTRLQLGGTERHMTALFTDIKGFSTIAEALKPEQLIDMLNFYLSTMSDVILEQEGTIDKYEGDAIVSFFGAPLDLPDHAVRACTAAVIMKRLETNVNRYVMENNLSPQPLYTRVGINTGEMVVGNMGTQKKMNYTIMSSAVNMASRLEGVNKQYGTWILASENTIIETKGKFITRQLDRVRVVGIRKPIRIYEVLEIKENASAELQDKINLFHKALNLFEERSWEDARIGFDKILKLFPGDEPSLFYLNRCRQYLQTPPEDDWDGVFILDSK